MIQKGEDTAHSARGRCGGTDRPGKPRTAAHSRAAPAGQARWPAARRTVPVALAESRGRTGRQDGTTVRCGRRSRSHRPHRRGEPTVAHGEAAGTSPRSLRDAAAPGSGRSSEIRGEGGSPVAVPGAPRHRRTRRQGVPRLLKPPRRRDPPRNFPRGEPRCAAGSARPSPPRALPHTGEKKQTKASQTLPNRRFSSFLPARLPATPRRPLRAERSPRRPGGVRSALPTGGAPPAAGTSPAERRREEGAPHAPARAAAPVPGQPRRLLQSRPPGGRGRAGTPRPAPAAGPPRAATAARPMRPPHEGHPGSAARRAARLRSLARPPLTSRGPAPPPSRCPRHGPARPGSARRGPGEPRGERGSGGGDGELRPPGGTSEARCRVARRLAGSLSRWDTAGGGGALASLPRGEGSSKQVCEIHPLPFQTACQAARTHRK